MKTQNSCSISPEILLRGRGQIMEPTIYPCSNKLFAAVTTNSDVQPSDNFTPQRRQSRNENFLKTILDVGYYSGTIPYHITFDTSLQEFTIRKSRIQTTFSGVVLALTLFSHINHILTLKADMLYKDPTLYFQIFRRVAFLINFAAWFASLWRNSIQLKTFVALSSKGLPGNYRQQAKLLTTAFTVTYLTVGVLGSIFIVDKTIWQPKLLVMAYLNRTKSKRFFNTSMPPNIRLESISMAPIALTLVQFSADFWHDATTWIRYAVMMVSVITIWMHVRAFEDVVTETTSATRLSHGWVLDRYANLKVIFGNINSIFGPTLLSWVVYIVPYIALRVSELGSHDGDWFYLMFNAVYFSHVFIFLVLAADSSTKVSCLNEWLGRDDVLTYIDSKKQNALFVELRNNVVAFRSANGVFAITYEFIGNLFALMTSFFIIITQFKMACPNSLDPS